MELRNVTLDDPAEGTLVTKFPIVNFQNIFVERCRCDLVHYLFTENPGIRSNNENNINDTLSVDYFKQKMETYLSDHIKCHPPDNPDRNVWVHPKEDCISKITEKPIVVEKEIEKIDYKLIIVPLIGVLAVATIIVIIVVRCSNQKDKKKANLVNNWQFHAPKEIQLMDEDKQFVYVSQVPESPIFSTVEVDVEMRDFQPPDIVIDSMCDSLDQTTFPIAKLKHHSLDVVSRAGSVIIHEDVD